MDAYRQEKVRATGQIHNRIVYSIHPQTLGARAAGTLHETNSSFSPAIFDYIQKALLHKKPLFPAALAHPPPPAAPFAVSPPQHALVRFKLHLIHPHTLGHSNTHYPHFHPQHKLQIIPIPAPGVDSLTMLVHGPSSPTPHFVVEGTSSRRGRRCSKPKHVHRLWFREGR